MIIKYIPLSILSMLVISVIFYFKIITIFIIETYTSLIVEKNLVVTEFDITNSKISGYIQKIENKININILNALPLELAIDFSGNIDAFSKYHPLKGMANIHANLFYNDSLLIKSKSSLYYANIDTTIKEINGKYKIDIDIQKLNLSSYQKQNSQDYNLSAIVDAKVSLTGLNDVTLSLKTKELLALDKKVKNIGIDFKLQNKIFILNSSSKLPYLGKTTIVSNGTISKYISAKANIQFQNKNIDINSLKYKDKNLSIESSIFDGKIDLNLKNDKLNFILSHIDIKKLAKFSNKEMPATGYINSEGFIDLNSQDSKIILSSELITTNDIKIKNIFLEGGSYKKLFNFKIDSNLNNKNLKIDGRIDYKNKLKIYLQTHKFESDTSFSYKNEHFKLTSKHLNLESIEKEFTLKHYVSSDVDLDAYGTLDEIYFNIKTKKLNILKYPNYFKHEINANIPGVFKNNIITINPTFKNKNFILSNGQTIYDLKTKQLNLSQKLVLFYEKEKVPINISAKIKLEKPFNTKALITHDKDSINITSFSYSKNNLKTNFSIDIKELDKYKAITKKDIHGPAIIKAKYDKYLTINTPSLGGDLELNLDKDVLFIKFDSLELTKIDNMLNMDSLFDSGYLDGNIHYHKPTESADTYIVASNTTLNGIDLDEKLVNIQDTIGLNVVNIGHSIFKNFQNSKKETKIKQLQLNISLNNKNIQLNDVALSTKKFRIVALGNIKDDGNITNLDINIVDKHGCAILTQDLIGNIISPKVANTTGAVFDIVSHMPSAILNTGKKVINFGTTSVDSIASFVINSSQITDKQVSLTTDITKKSTSIITNTSDIILPNECKVIYNGKIKHPIQNY